MEKGGFPLRASHVNWRESMILSNPMKLDGEGMWGCHWVFMFGVAQHINPSKPYENYDIIDHLKYEE